MANGIREQRADQMPDIMELSSRLMSEEGMGDVQTSEDEEIDSLVQELALTLEEHGVEHPKTKSILNRLEELKVEKDAAIAQAMKADPHGFGQDKAVAKGTKDLSQGAADTATEGGRGGPKGTGAGTGDALESKPKPASGGTADASEKAGKPIGGGTSKR